MFVELSVFEEFFGQDCEHESGSQGQGTWNEWLLEVAFVLFGVAFFFCCFFFFLMNGGVL